MNRLNKYLLCGLIGFLWGCENAEDPIPQGCMDADFSANVVSTEASGCEDSKGSVTVSATGAASGYTYTMDGNSNDTGVFEGLVQGEYTIVVADDGECTTTVAARVISGITYTDHARAIFEKSCAVTGCHVAGTGLPQWLIYDVAQASAASIKSQTQSGNMPQDGTLTAEEIAILACWADDDGPL